MRVKGMFGSIGSGLLKIEKKLASKNKTLSKLAKNGSLRFLGLLLLVIMIGGVAYGISKLGNKQIAKITLNADASVPSLFLGHMHFNTVINGHSLNEVSPPATEAEWNWEKDHLDSVIASTHARGIFDRNRNDAAKTLLSRYILINSTEGKINSASNYSNTTTAPPAAPPDASIPEVVAIHDFCTGTGTDQNGYARPGLSEIQFEDAFLHFKVNTTLQDKHFNKDGAVYVDRVINGYDQGNVGSANSSATIRKDSRVINDRGYGDFYMLNLGSRCAQEYKASKAFEYVTKPQALTNKDGSDNTVDGGVVFDSLFVDEMLGGARATLISPKKDAGADLGGIITEYNMKPEEIASAATDAYATDQASILSFVRNGVKEKLGHDFVLSVNTAENRSVDDPNIKIAEAAGFDVTEMWSGDSMGSRWGEKVRWDYANHFTDQGLYFGWSERDPDSLISNNPSYNYTPSNYAGSTGGIKQVGDQAVATDPTGKEARHDMVALTGYLIAKDQNHRMVYSQKGWEESSYGVPLSQYWVKAREMNIGQPTSDKYSLWKSSLTYKPDYSPATPNTTEDNNDTLTQSDGRTHYKQPVMVYRRDYEHAVVLFRTFSDAYDFCMPDPNNPGKNIPDLNTPDPNDCLKTNWNYGAQSEQFDLGGDYRVLYPDGNLGPTINKISLAVQEGVVLIPESYKDSVFADGPPPSTNAQITMSDGGTHSIPETFPVTVNLNPNGNTVCAATFSVTFPKELIAFESGTLGSTYTLDVESTQDNNNGTMTYNLAARNCSTQSDALATINFRASGPGTGDINFSSVKVVGGPNRTDMVDITTEATGTQVTITGSPITAPTTTLEITNGAAANQEGWYTEDAPVLRLKAVPQSGSTVANIKYHWGTDEFTTVDGDTINNITAPEGNHTITYYATDDKGNEEIPKTQTFLVDTSTPPDPNIDPYNQVTYKSSILLKGTKDSSVVDVFTYIFNESGSSTKSRADLSGDNWEKNVTLFLAPENYSCTDSDGNPATCIRAKATKVELTTTNQAKVESLPKVVNITRHMIADADGDMVVGTTDMGTVKLNWLSATPHVMSDMNNNGNGDGKCDIYDFGVLAANWTEE